MATGSRAEPSGRGWLLLAAVPLLPALAVGFLLDDWVGLDVLGQNGWVAVANQFRPLGGEFLRPLGWALFQLERSVFGLRAVWFHALHLGLFLLAAALAGRLTSRLAGDDRLVTFGAVLAVLYPGRTESYVWLGAAFDLLVLVLGLTLLLLYLERRRRASPGGALLLFTLAFAATLAKESAYALLPVVLAWELLPGLLEPAPRCGRLRAATAVAAGLVTAWCYRLWALGTLGGYAGTGVDSTLARLPVYPVTVFRASFEPVNPGYGAWSTGLRAACAAALAACLAVGLARARRSAGARRLLAAGVVLGLCGLLPALPYLSGDDPWAQSRYLTLFGAGLALIGGAVLADGRRKQEGWGDRFAKLAAASLVAAWTAATGLNLVPWLAAARSRDLILATVEADTRSPERQRVWIDGPLHSVKGALILGGALEPALRVTFPERRIAADCSDLQRFQGRPVGPPRSEQGTQLHLYRFDPGGPSLVRLPAVDDGGGSSGAGSR